MNKPYQMRKRDMKLGFVKYVVAPGTMLALIRNTELVGGLMRPKRFVAIATTVGVKTKENYATRDNLPSHPKKWD